jgi:hypothetical protein
MSWRGLRDAEKREIILKIINAHPEGLMIAEICKYANASFSPVLKSITELYYMKKIRKKVSKSNWIKLYYPKKQKGAGIFKE